MNRILLFFLLFSACLSACTKTTDVTAQIQAQEAIDDKIITAYLKSKNITASVVDSTGISTGIYYTIDTPATGNALYTNSTSVTVGYTGWLLTNGSLGNAFTQTGKFHPSFVLGSVIRGWQLGLENPPGVQAGETVTLYLPSHYAYGPFPQPDIGLPANAVLVFQITVYNVTN
jgi:FKBP-type peptidyl-prolyl cis-trans isomerase FkpA